MTHAIVTQIENTAAWVFLVLVIAFILGAFWALVDAGLGYASARVIHPRKVVDLDERRRQLNAASGQGVR